MSICPTKWKIDGRKRISYEDLSRERTTNHIVMGDINGHIGRNIDGIRRFMDELALTK